MRAVVFAAAAAGLVWGAGGPVPAWSEGTIVSNDTITSNQGPLSTNGYAPTPVTLPLVLSGHTEAGPLAGLSRARAWYLGISSSVDGANYQTYIYCANTLNTDPSAGYGQYGAPPVDADGNWTCDVATDPNAATDYLFMFDPNAPMTYTAGGNGSWDLGNSWGSVLTYAGGSPTYSVQFVPVEGAPVVWWPAGTATGVLGLAGWVWRQRRRPKTLGDLA